MNDNELNLKKTQRLGIAKPVNKHQIVSKLQSSLQGDSQGENRNAQESISLGSISDIEQQVQLMRTKPQKGTKYLQMMGIVEERISPEND
jgi:hypothetical protein